VRVISIGRNQGLLDRLASALREAGHEAVGTNKLDSPLLDAPYDVVAFGRAVTAEERTRLESGLWARNPGIVSFVGMAPEVGVLKGQVESAAAGADFSITGDIVRFRLDEETELRWRVRRVNLLFRASERVVHVATYPPGAHSMRIDRRHKIRLGNNFLQVEAGGRVIFTAPV
jgi:hypothetical protein